MKSFKEFLLEEKHTEESVIEQIRKDCAPFLKEMADSYSNGRYLFRGVKQRSIFGANVNELIEDPVPVISGTVRKDRRSDSSPQRMHAIFDEYFNAEFGWKYRSAALFVTGDDGSAAEYGEAYIVLPVGDYEMVTSEVVDDMYLDLIPRGEKSLNRFVTRFFGDKDKCKVELDKSCKKFMSQSDFSKVVSLDSAQSVNKLAQIITLETQNTPAEKQVVEDLYTNVILPKCEYFKAQSVKDAMGTYHEIMMKCDRWYGIKLMSGAKAFINRILSDK